MIEPGDSLFAVFNPTIGTGRAHALKTTFAATAAYLMFRNPLTSLVRIWPKYLRLILTSTPATGQTSLDFAVVLDPGARDSQLPLSNDARTPVSLVRGNASSRASVLSLVNVAAGDMPADAANAGARTVARARLQTGLHVAGDEILLQFDGGFHPPHGPLTAARATAPARFMAQVSPCVVLPGETFVLHRWATGEATTAPSYEYEFVWGENQ